MSAWFKKSCPHEEVQSESQKLFNFNTRPEVWEMLKENEGWRKYVTKYALKREQKIVPKGFEKVGRFWGCDKDTRPSTKLEVDVTEEDMREYLMSIDHPTKSWPVLPKFLVNAGRKENATRDKNGHITRDSV